MVCYNFKSAMITFFNSLVTHSSLPLCNPWSAILIIFLILLTLITFNIFSSRDVPQTPPTALNRRHLLGPDMSGTSGAAPGSCGGSVVGGGGESGGGGGLKNKLHQ